MSFLDYVFIQRNTFRPILEALLAATKKLLIVESPAKAKTIKKILGKDFTVKASVGHIRDLKSSGRGKKALGIDIDHGYKPDYTIIKGKEKTVKELQDAAAKADEVYLAPDPDREGEGHRLASERSPESQ